MLQILIIQSLVFVLAAVLHAYYADARQIRIKAGWQKWLLGLSEHIAWLFLSIGQGLGLLAPAFLFALVWRWFLHDLTMNIIRNRHWFDYFGELNNRSLTDRFLFWWKDQTGISSAVIKIILLVLTIGLVSELI